MQLLFPIALNFLPAVVAFALGVLWRRTRKAIVFFRARRFWRPVISDDLQIVLGGFGDLRGFEASGLIGRGDVLAMNELVAYFQKIGYGAPRVSYADELGHYDLTGKSLRSNMIIIGGPDVNSIARDILDRVNLGVDFAGGEIDESLPMHRQERRLKLHPIGRFSQFFAIERTNHHEILLIRDLKAPRDQKGSGIYRPSIKNGKVLIDYGVVARSPNPFDPDKNVVLLGGAYGYGTWGAVRFAQSPRFLNELKKLPKEASTIECLFGVEIVRESPQNIRPEFVRSSPRNLSALRELVGSGRRPGPRQRCRCAAAGPAAAGMRVFSSGSRCRQMTCPHFGAASSPDNRLPPAGHVHRLRKRSSGEMR